MKKLPAFLKKYFWDIDFAKLNPEKSPEYVIERVLEFGDENAVRWVFKNFSKNAIKKTVTNRRGLSPKTANFWAAFLGIDKKYIACLQTPYLKIRQTHWPY